MSLNFMLLVLISSCFSPVLCTNKDDEAALLRIKEQLGNPSDLESWVKGFNYCQERGIKCSSTGRLINLALGNYITPIYASFPRAVCELTELRDLQVYLVQLYGPIPSCINKLSNLVSLDIRDTHLSGPLPGFPYHQKLTSIVIKFNLFSGSIPPSLSTLPNLLYLDLSSNNLTGSIPPGLIRNSSSDLSLSNNSLTGELPKCYGWRDFRTFDVSLNHLVGDASFLFGKQKTSIGMKLGSNEFEFDLSHVQIQQTLRVLDLSRNKIWGRIPDSLATFDQLYILDLSYNKLCGEIPQGGQLGRFDAVYYANNACLCGKPLPPCFNSAPTPALAPTSVNWKP